MTGPSDPTFPSASDPSTELHAEEAYCSACNQSFPSGTTICPNDGARLIKLAAQRDELIGRVLDSRYEIRAPLGKGGMGTVYRGWQLSVDREVAIKVIHPKLSNDRQAVKRFLREARLASRLSQPNIVNVYDFGQSDGVLYLVMELLRGHTLASELGQGRRINHKRTTTVALQLCDALEAAHAQGIVHRDLKPSNIVILDDPPGRDLIKVLDFGLAKSLVQDSGSVVTNTDALLGTPLYMAPEQIEGKVSDQRADLYSFGCILYEMLTGRPPFVDNAVSAVLARHMHDVHIALPLHVPARLRDLIDKLLAKTPEDRLQTAGEMRRILEDVRDSVPTLGKQATPLAIQIPDTPDTIPDISPELAETHAAPNPPTPVGRIVGVTSQTQPPTPGGAKPKRYAIVAFFALIPLAVGAFVMFNVMNRSKQAANTGGSGAPTVKGNAFAGSGSDFDRDRGSDDKPTLAQDPAPIVDAGVDAPAVEVVVPPPAADAGVKKKPEHRKPRVRSDAGAEPDIDFLPTKK
ncbi:MAG TPA: serine/threonine-protein kinase [Kofleriaceae bacterium]|nr:serine/threonine-protein kinase [Kofleriaceae bacterium]